MHLQTWILVMALAVAPAMAVAPVMADTQQQMASIGNLELSSGDTLLDARVGYRTAGSLNADRSNVLVLLTWFTGSTDSLARFEKFGPGKLADTDRFFVVAIDALGNGVSSSPSNSTRQPGSSFPGISIGDMVRSQHALLTRHLGIDQAAAVVGASMGGMQALQWAGQYPDFMDRVVAIDGSPRATSWDLLQWQTHALAIRSLQDAGAGNAAVMKLIGSLKLLTLWTPDYIVDNVTPDSLPGFIESAGQDTAAMDPDDYLSQLQAMVSHDVYAVDSSPAHSYIDRIRAEILIIGTTSDHMVHPGPARELGQLLGADYMEIDSNCGHLGSSCEADRVAARVHAFLKP